MRKLLEHEWIIKFSLRQTAALLVSPIGVLVALCFWLIPWGAESAPAWVQAVGSIAAVAAAFAVSNQQSRQQARDKRNKDLVVYHLVVDVAQRAAAVSSLLFRSFDDLQSQVNETKEEILTTIDSQVLALRGINPADLPRHEMVEPFLKIKAAMEQSYVMAGLLANGRPGYIDQLRCAHTFAMNSQAIHTAAKELQRISLD